MNGTVTDLMPAGFHFRAGSGSIDGKRLDPTVSGRELTWTHLSFAAGQIKDVSRWCSPSVRAAAAATS